MCLRMRKRRKEIAQQQSAHNTAPNGEMASAGWYDLTNLAEEQQPAPPPYSAVDPEAITARREAGEATVHPK